MKNTYGNEIYKNARSYAVWMPGSSVALGDYGVIKENCFERIGSIRQLAPGFTPSEATSALDSFSFLSEGVAEARMKATGKLIKVNYSVSKNSAVVFYAKALSVISISNIVELATHLSRSQKWDRSWQIVTSLTTARDFYVMIGGQAGTAFTVTADADAFPYHMPFDKASATFRVEGKCALHLAGKNGAVMVNLHRMKMFGKGLKYAATTEEKSDSREVLVPCVEKPSEIPTSP